MKLEFCLKSNKTIDAYDLSKQMACIYHQDKKMLDFEMTDYCIGEIPIFFEGGEYVEIEGKISQDVLGCINRIYDSLQDIKAVLLCSHNEFLDILKWHDGKMNVGTWVTGVRGLIVYGTIGEGHSTLLISYSISDK
ncbi:MAG: hypothetical protein IJE68_03810 [Clostridia bacterium]|nr:hypothetical protein [Clostridia bacterium]